MNKRYSIIELIFYVTITVVLVVAILSTANASSCKEVYVGNLQVRNSTLRIDVYSKVCKSKGRWWIIDEM